MLDKRISLFNQNSEGQMAGLSSADHPQRSVCAGSTCTTGPCLCVEKRKTAFHVCSSGDRTSDMLRKCLSIELSLEVWFSSLLSMDVLKH